MPRFRFPVPGRRHKQESVAVLSPPLDKVQKLLGSSQFNLDSTISIPTSSIPNAEGPKHWETASNSAISINISDSAMTYDDESQVGALPSLTEGGVVGGPRSGRFDGFEEESGVLPRAFGDDDTNGDLYGHDGLSITDASSLRRKQSSSTIISYYDKTKVPLGISQQTSSSAMAKGLPTKASSLLDIDGSISQASRKKKPAKLDLSRMFANRKSASTTLNADRGLILGPDMVTRSPSFMSVSPLEYLTRPHSSHRSERRLRRGSNREELSDSGPKQRSSTKLSNGSQRHTAKSQEANGLQNLYEHYEQMTFRNVFAEEAESPSDAATPGESEDDMAAPMSPLAVPQIYQEALDGADTHTEQYPPRGIRELPLYKDISAYLGGYAHANIPHIETSDLPTLQAPVDDCSDSISSRHTRTSKASKRTAQSLLEIDLQQTSVLSLSSDSEDDFVDARPTTSSTSALPSPRSQPDIRASSRESYRPTTARSLLSSKKSKDRSSGRSDMTVQFLPVPGSHDSQRGPLLPATAYSRTSSASASTNSTAKPSIRGIRSPSRESRISVATNRTTASASPANYSVHEARAITLIPAQGAAYKSSMHNHNHTSSSDQLTPPLSPSSMDFMMRSNHTSIYDGDQGSITSANGSFSAESSRSPTAGQGRFMAVTRQEELLLAALRKKRLRMRKSIIAEFEEEQEKGKALDQDTSPGQLPKPAREIRRTSIDAVLELHSPQPRSMSQMSVSFNDFPMHFEDSPFPVPPSAGIRNSLRCSSAMSVPLSPRSKPPTGQLPPTPVAKAAVANADLDRVLMNMSNATAGRKASSSGSGTGSGSGSGSTPASDRSEDIFGGGAERSPRLSDCLDFDDGGSGSIESYDSFNFETSADQSPIAAAAARRRPRYKHKQPVSPPTMHDSEMDDGMDADDDDDYSIPDDEVEPAGMPYDDFVGTDRHNASATTSPAYDDEPGIPRPDSPLEAPMHFHQKSAVRISAVGFGIGAARMEPGWWGHND